jgi:hypothetical protein
MQNEPVEVTLKVTGEFEKLGVPYLIGGSLASTLYGMVRTTQDSDVIAEMRLENLQPFVLALQDEFYVDEEMVAEAIQRNSSFNLIHRNTIRSSNDIVWAAKSRTGSGAISSGCSKPEQANSTWNICANGQRSSMSAICWNALYANLHNACSAWVILNRFRFRYMMKL